jgi:hypothetical protein
MNKLLIGLVATASLIGCAVSSDGPTPVVDDHTYTVGDRTFTLEEGRGVAKPPLASFQESNVVAGCWVVLDWCTSPTTGGAECHFTNCTIERAIDACESLIDSHC